MDPVPGAGRVSRGRPRVSTVAGKGAVLRVVQDRRADLILAAQAPEVLFRRLRGIEDQGGQAIAAHRLGQDLQVPHHLTSQQMQVGRHEQGAGDGKGQLADGRGDAQQACPD